MRSLSLEFLFLRVGLTFRSYCGQAEGKHRQLHEVQYVSRYDLLRTLKTYIILIYLRAHTNSVGGPIIWAKV